MIFLHVSRPTMSASVNGPIGWPCEVVLIVIVVERRRKRVEEGVEEDEEEGEGGS